MSLGDELEGMIVVSIDQAVAAPYCSLLLADAGARVIKIERPEGDFARRYDRGADGQSSIFAWLNRGKESICIDLEDETDRALLHRMTDHADVFLSNLAPGALARRGFGSDSLRERNPRLITCDISGYGNTGPAANRKAYDFLVQAESGICAVTGSAEQPAKVGISICDIGTGLTAFSAILRGLIKRSISGEGMSLSISMFDVMADWMNMPLVSHRYMGVEPKRLGLTHSFIAPYGAFRTGDGGQVLIAIQSNREWGVFCEQILEKPGLADDARYRDNTDRFANRDTLHEEIRTCFSNHSVESLCTILDDARVANARLSSVDDLSHHPYLRNLAINYGEASIDVADLPVGVSTGRKTSVPLLDQHGSAIREEFSAG